MKIYSPTPIRSKLQYIEPKVFPFAKSKFSEQRGNDQAQEVEKVLEESREREARINDRLQALKDQVRLVVGAQKAEDATKEEQKQTADRMGQYVNQLNVVKDTIENILSVTKETHNEVQRTKDIVAGIQNESPSKASASFRSVFIEDCDENQICEGTSPQFRLTEGDRPALTSTPILISPTNEDECVSTVSWSKREPVEYVMTTEDQLESIDEGQCAVQIAKLREQIKDCERKALQTEGARLDKERENLDLKETVLKMKKELEEKERKLKQMEPQRPIATVSPVRFEQNG